MCKMQLIGELIYVVHVLLSSPDTPALSIVDADNHSLNTIEGSHMKDARYSLHKLIPWSSSSSSDEMILNMFSESMDMLSQITETLILKAKVRLKNLVYLEGNHFVIRDTIVREALEVPADRSEIIWGLVHNYGLSILDSIGGCLQTARQHVSSALHMLHVMRGNTAALRERVVKPASSGSSIPPEVHVDRIKRVLGRLEASNHEARERERDAQRLPA